MPYYLYKGKEIYFVSNPSPKILKLEDGSWQAIGYIKDRGSLLDPHDSKRFDDLDSLYEEMGIESSKKGRGKILIATNNKGKLREYEEMLSPLGYEVVSLRSLNIVSNPPETGSTYEENAFIKAMDAARQCDIPVLADDSGYEVEALYGFPGTHSARFCEQLGGDYEKAGSFLSSLIGEQGNRKSHFHCTICLIENRDGDPLYFKGDFPGELLSESHGENGFGYDPYFHSDELDCDMGIADDELKNKVSHRRRALEKLIKYLEKRS